ncbi:MAG: Flp pilus assembly complex ATPase component TadA [Lactobacillales bacterium]|jgi:competence protein ComGA|nr:Flp pilus assembly complex ATPase component TadA [Lactobacillales bacterium]
MDVKEYAKKILEKGVSEGVNDFYLLPRNRGYQLFFRKINKMELIDNLETKFGEMLIVHFKYRGGMSVGERRRAQLGAFSEIIHQKERRFRLSTVGDFKQQESLVLRFLHVLGEKKCEYFFPEQFERLIKMTRTRGLFLFCGPVGSGKTTTLYELCKERHFGNQIIAIEDPVEVVSENILQLQVNESIGSDYDSLIKLCLRHRPDILVVGEIRDEKTARAVVRATLTGHTVFSTLHARNIQGVYQRLLELGVSEGELRECLEGIIYQRIFASSDRTPAALFDIALRGRDWSEQSQWKENIEFLFKHGCISEETYHEEKNV